MSGRFEILDTSIEGLKVIRREPRGDSRGYLERLFCAEEFHKLMPEGKHLEQINHTSTVKTGTIRGMHFQYSPHCETKFVSCLCGEVFDVAVDLRSHSSSFLHWHAEILSAKNHTTLLIPDGFAHGFQTLVGDVEMLYFHTAAYHAESEGGLNPCDPALAIQWPRPIAELSDRDAAHPVLDHTFGGVEV